VTTQERTATIDFGLFLNTGEFPGTSHEEIFDLTVSEAELAEELGYHSAWITEHHFIPFGVNSNALAAAAFLLGRTRRLRVGTAVTLAPQYHPVQLAEQAAVLDQLSRGRFDFGIGRGGYAREFEVFGVDTGRWEVEIENTARILLDRWTNEEASSDSDYTPFSPVRVNPRPRTRPHPPLHLATSSQPGFEFAARHGLPIMHYFGSPIESRISVDTNYREALIRNGRDQRSVSSLHTVICLITDDETAGRERLLENITYSYRTGDWPSVPQSANRHAGPDGKPVDRERFAQLAVDSAFVGNPASVTEQVEAYLHRTSARRVALFFEPAVERAAIESSIVRFAREVARRFGGSLASAAE
jgi:alkanesulfonate monooxygenase SsuD/methylene tetrahydromethanopterin reductase-like flavin-dependent oxidoreductase (luciferase family)